MTPTLATADWDLWSTSARLVVTDSTRLESALALVRETLAEIELAASRFRPDSEVSRLAASRDPGSAAGARTRAEVSPVLADLITEALVAAEWTEGAVDPTVGNTLTDLGYDRDITELDLTGRRPVVRVRRTPGWRTLTLDSLTLGLPAGLIIDLGATAKAVAADRCAERVSRTLGCGALVALGGDIATAGPGPAGGWLVRVHDTDDDPETVLSLPAGAAVATSSTVRRTWQRGDATVHHIVDPRTASPARSPWRSVSVVADTCATANAAATATIAKGPQGADWLATHDLPARLVGHDRRVHTIGRWHEEEVA